MTSRSLTIIIVSYNGEFWLKKTLQTLDEFYRQKTATQVKTVVVDNGSSDDITGMIKNDFPWVHLLASPTNLGFAGANNLALFECDSDFVMLLNPDTQLDERSRLDHLLDQLESHPEWGMIGPRLVMTDGQLDPACHRGEPTLWASFCYFARLEKLFPRLKFFAGYHRHDLDLTTCHPVDAISGAATIVSRTALTDVGPLDANFFLYGEDLDWCRRFREAGYQVVYDPAVTIIHHKHKTGIANKDAAISGQSKIYFYDTMLQYFDKYQAEHYPRFVRTLLSWVILWKKVT